MPEPLKNLYRRAYVDRLASDCVSAHAPFNRNRFISDVFDRQWARRELKDRMHHIAQCLRAHLPEDYTKAVRILEKVSERRRSLGGNAFTDMIFPDFVEQFGIDFPQESIRALERFTVLSSSEFAVRPYIIKYPDMMMSQMMKWSKHPSEHVRRLASEGCRPRLPWAMALPMFKKDPSPVIRVLENLKADPSEYVRRSVANNLNDISKDHPDLVVELARRWKSRKPETDALIKHALRGLLKKGDRRALELFGFRATRGAKIIQFAVNPVSVKIGGHVRLRLKLAVAEETSLRIDYAVHFLTSTGRVSKKVFRWTEKKTQGSVQIEKKQSFKNLTIRNHHPGKHKIDLLINGQTAASRHFHLK